jgi:hypothetical protein
MQQEGVYISSVTGWVLAAVITLIAIPFIVWVVTSIFKLENKVDLVSYNGKNFDEKLDKIELRLETMNTKLDSVIRTQWRQLGRRDDEEKDE